MNDQNNYLPIQYFIDRLQEIYRFNLQNYNIIIKSNNNMIEVIDTLLASIYQKNKNKDSFERFLKENSLTLENIKALNDLKEEVKRTSENSMGFDSFSNLMNNINNTIKEYYDEEGFLPPINEIIGNLTKSLLKVDMDNINNSREKRIKLIYLSEFGDKNISRKSSGFEKLYDSLAINNAKVYTHSNAFTYNIAYPLLELFEEFSCFDRDRITKKLGLNFYQQENKNISK